ncbi:MAG: hypothetical protein K9M51_02535 [Candidatus Gracilibacteria bacterium]|nr:hypothetical protein [Candidatus Gracilibacteria bacterium]
MQWVSKSILLPETFVFPPTGVALTLVERGMMGALLISGLLFSHKIFPQRKASIFAGIGLLFWLASPASVGSENGILLLCVLALLQTPTFSSSPKLRFQRSEKTSG